MPQETSFWRSLGNLGRTGVVIGALGLAGILYDLGDIKGVNKEIAANDWMVTRLQERPEIYGPQIENLEKENSKLLTRLSIDYKLMEVYTLTALLGAGLALEGRYRKNNQSPSKIMVACHPGMEGGDEW